MGCGWHGASENESETMAGNKTLVLLQVSWVSGLTVLESVWVLPGSAKLSTLHRLPLGYRATRDHVALAQLLICD